MDRQETLRRLQETELEILLVIDEFCRENGITWFMQSGTALGAVRHQGFIPWDDDIDIGLMRPDYDRFLELAEKGLPKGYSLHTARNTPGFAALFAKVFKDGTRFENQESREAGCPQGIFVDVFPFDLVPKDPAAARRMTSRAASAQRLSYLYHAATINVPHRGALGALERGACRVAHHAVRLLCKGPDALQDRYDRALTCETGELSDRCFMGSWPDMAPVEVSRILPVSYATFEGHRLPVPHDVEHHLETMYGDWRRIPAPEERHTHLPLLVDFGDGAVWTAGDAS